MNASNMVESFGKFDSSKTINQPNIGIEEAQKG